MSKKIKCIIFIVVIVAAIVIAAVLISIFSTKPKNYKEIIKSVEEAFSDEKKMEKVIEDGKIDLRAAVAWREADFDLSNFNSIYKNIEKDDERIEELEEALKSFSEMSSIDGLKITNIKKPEQCKENRNIWTVQAKWSHDDGSEPVTFVFYKGKVIDVNGNGDLEYINSLFEIVLKDYTKLDENINSEKTNTEILFKVDDKFINRYGYITDYENYSVISVEGLEINNNQEKIEEKTFSKISNLISELKNNELIGKVIKIDVSNMDNIVIDMSVDKKIVRFGDLNNISEKCKMIAKILKVEEGLEGEIFVNVDINNGEKPYFREKV